MKTNRHSLRKNSGVAALFILLAAGAAQGATSDWKTASSAWWQSIALEQKGNFDGALAKMTTFYQTSSDIYLTNLRTGWLYYRQKKYTQAEEAYQTAASAAPTALNPLLGMANSYRAARDTTRAAQISEQVLTLDPLNYNALMMLGGIHYERQDYQRAAKTYKTLLDAYPEDPAALSGTAWSLLKLNMKQDAVTDFQRLLSIAPSYPFAQQGLNMATGSSNSTAPTPAPTQPQ